MDLLTQLFCITCIHVILSLAPLPPIWVLPRFIIGCDRPYPYSLLICSLTRFTDTLVIGGSKFLVTVARSGPTAFTVSLNGTSVDVRTRKMVDGGFLMQARTSWGTLGRSSFICALLQDWKSKSIRLRGVLLVPAQL